jgi:hypothetical protein
MDIRNYERGSRVVLRTFGSKVGAKTYRTWPQMAHRRTPRVGDPVHDPSREPDWNRNGWIIWTDDRNDPQEIRVEFEIGDPSFIKLKKSGERENYWIDDFKDRWDAENGGVWMLDPVAA